MTSIKRDPTPFTLPYYITLLYLRLCYFSFPVPVLPPFHCLFVYIWMYAGMYVCIYEYFMLFLISKQVLERRQDLFVLFMTVYSLAILWCEYIRYLVNMFWINKHGYENKYSHVQFYDKQYFSDSFYVKMQL